MQAADLPCPSCKRPLPREASALAALTACPACGEALEVISFPALGQGPRTGLAAEPLSIAGDAACFQHPSKKAVVPCDTCGRFLCALCDLEVDGSHLCPACLESGRKKGSVSQLERSRVRWDRIAIGLNVLVLICVFLAPVSAIANTVITIMQWRRSQSRVAASRAWLLGATLFSCVLALGLATAAWVEWSKPDGAE